MVFDATFNNISAILLSWRPVLFWWRKLEYTEKTINLSVNDTLSHNDDNVVSSTPRLSSVPTHNLVVIGTNLVIA